MKRLLVIFAVLFITLSILILVISGSIVERRRQDSLTKGDPRRGYVCLDWHCGTIKYCDNGKLIIQKRYRFVRSIKPTKTLAVYPNSSNCSV
jgi:hypothetical protein